MSVEELIVAKPRGFCAGVEMAVDTVEQALKQHGAPIYVFHEIVHNQYVVRDLTGRGVHFVQSIDEVPMGAKLIFSAHGISPTVWREAKERGMQLIVDATCPLVEKVHREVRKFAAQGYWIVLVGHEQHDEIVGTSGEAPERVRIVATIEDAKQLVIPDSEKVAVLTQTTLSVDDTYEVIEILKQKFPKLVMPAKGDICYATQNRQDAVKALAGEVDLLLVIGSRNSENSNQLRKVAESRGVRAYLIDDYRSIDPRWLDGVKRVGLTSGASVPEDLVESAVDFFSRQGAKVSQLGFAEENIHFALPTEIRPPP